LQTHQITDHLGRLCDPPFQHGLSDGELFDVQRNGTTSFAIIQNASDGGNVASLAFYLLNLLC
jgi:hypothetical protein